MKKVKQFLMYVTLLFAGNMVFAQQESIIALYREQMNLVNPAYAGVDGQTDLAIGYRKQWVNVNSAPTLKSAMFGTAMGKNFGMGLTVVNNKVYIENETFIGVDFSYKLMMSPSTDLYLGLKAGGNFYDVNTSNLQLYDGTSDAALNSRSTFNPNFGIGALLKSNKAYVSLSIPRILNTERARFSDGKVAVATDRPHFYLSGGFDYDLENISMMVLKPSFMLREVSGAPISVDFNLGASFLDAFEIGVMYRLNNASGANARINISKNLLFGYAYEINTRKELTSALSTHEFVLKYKFK